MELQDYLSVVRKRWRVILLVVLVCVGLASAATLTATKIYESSTQFFVSTTGSEDSGALLQGSTFTQQRVKSYAQLLTTPRILAPVAAAVGVTGDIAGQVTATTPPDTVLIEVAVRDSDPAAGQGHGHGDRQGVPQRGHRAREPRRQGREPGQGDRRAAPDHPDVAGQPQAGAQHPARRGARPAARPGRGPGPRDARQDGQDPGRRQGRHRRPDPRRHRARPGCRQASAHRRGRPPVAAGRGVPLAAHEPAVRRRREPPPHPGRHLLPRRARASRRCRPTWRSPWRRAARGSASSRPTCAAPRCSTTSASRARSA